MLRIGDNLISYRGKCLVALEKYAGKALKSDGPADGDEGRRRSEADSAGYGFLVPAVCVVPVVLDFRLVIRSLRGTGKLQFVADIARVGCSHQGEAQETFSACLEQRLLRIDGLRVGERAQIDFFRGVADGVDMEGHEGVAETFFPQVQRRRSGLGRRVDFGRLSDAP